MPKEVKYTISADSSKYERAMGRIKKSTQSVEAGLNKAFKAAGMIGAAGVGAFGLMARQSLKMGDEIHKLNLRLGISTEALSELRHVANLSGVNFNTMAKSYQKMSENISDANQGIGTAKDSMKDLGLNIGQIIKLSPEKQFEAIADAMMGISNQSDRVRIAADIFGGRGVEMLQVMSKGAAGLREMREEAADLGLTLSQEGANAIADVNDEFVRFKGAIMGAVQAAVINLAPTVTNMLEWFGTQIPKAIDFSVKAFEAIPAVVAIMVNKVVAGLIYFYDVLCKIPLIGEPYREAAAGLRVFSMELDNFAATSIAAMDRMEAAKTARAASGITTVSPLGIASAEEMDADLARLVEKEEMKFQIAMQSQTKLDEMLVGARARQLEADRIASEQRLSMFQSAAGGIAETFMMISQAGGKQSKKAFKIYQTFSIVEATISAYKAISKTLAEKTLPYPSNVIMAAIIGAKAMMQVRLIAAAKPPSYDQGGISTRPGMYYAGVPEAHVPLQSGSIPVVIEGGSRMSTIVNINMVNPTFEDKETREMVFSELAETVVERVAPDAVFNNYNDDGIIREMVRGGE